jgi:4-aminobutyrate aminotransferase-like enzyme
MTELAFLDVFRYTSKARPRARRHPGGPRPAGIAQVHFTPGGSEAVEAALKLALQYHWVRGTGTGASSSAGAARTTA